MAWELEAAGYRTMLQAWDFVPGTNFIDFMDRGLRQADAVIVVLSRHYVNSKYGRVEWQAALRADPGNEAGRLVTIRIEDCVIDPLLAPITYVDLVGVTDPGNARELLLNRISHALAGRAKPTAQVDYPTRKTIAGEIIPTAKAPAPMRSAVPPARRAPVTAPAYPPAVPYAAEPRPAVTILHVAGPRFGRGLVGSGEPLVASELQARIWADVTWLAGADVPRPDLMVVTGDLTESGSLRECDQALTFLTGLRALLGLEPHRVIVVPGSHDVTQAACRSYFASCEADDIEPQPPYWPKWRHFTGLFEEFYRGLDGLAFESAQPWTLYAIPDLRVVVAGLNSTMADSHRAEDHYGWIGEAQAAWFAVQLRAFEEAGWLRIGVLRHDPAPGAVAAGRDAALLRDAGTLDRLLGQRINLLLHGPGPGGDRADQLGSGLLVVPAEAPGRHQILRLTPDGLTRWVRRPDAPLDKSEQLAQRWIAAGGTFATAGNDLGGAGDVEAGLATAGAGAAAMPGPAPAALAAPSAEPERSASPASILLDRLAEVCEARYERAKVRRVPGDPPHLLITLAEDELIRQWHVAAHVGELTRDDVAAFLRLIHTGVPQLGSELVYDGPPPSQVLREEALRRGVRLRSFIEFQGLLDLREYVAEQTARLLADRLYPPALYVPQRFRELDRSVPGVREDLVAELLRQVATDHGRFVLVLGDFGRGKTFALHELARRIAAELPYLIPILIELRALDKSHSVDGLVAAHLANHGEDLIDLRAFRYMLRQGRIVLLFDGFDELVTRVTYERAADHLETLIKATEEKAKIVVASRTQHFKSHEQVFTALGERVGAVPNRRVLSLEDFTPAQIRAYLTGRYDGDEQAADHRLRLLSGIEDLLGLSRNPRMLSFIADLDESRLRAVAGANRTISAAGLYEEILRTWLAHEERRARIAPGAPQSLKLDDLWQSVSTLAMRLWETNESFLGLADLAEVADTLTSLAAGRLSSNQRAHAVGSGSLLARTDEGLFGFIHTSVVEWLVAAEIARQLNHGVADPRPLSRRPLSQLTVDFLCDLAGTRPCHAWAGRILADASADDVARSNAIRVSTRLRTPVQTDLRGASLKGEDLSYRDLQGVDLTGADLTDARLVGANLTRAVLRDASLTAARLDEARLTRADLRGADLTRARLARTDIRGAQLAGSRWTRAALVDVTADPGQTGAAELRGAAVVPGQPVEIELAPAAIGVPYGFHVQTSRLPEPTAYSRDGGTLAIGSEDGGVLICDTVSGLPVRTLHGHRGRVYAVASGPGDRVLATGASDGTARLWDPATGECLRTFAGHRAGVWPMTFGPDGGLIATGDGDGVLRLWDVATGQIRHQLAGHTAPIYTVAFSPDAALLAVGDAAALRLYDPATGSSVRMLSGQRGPVYRAVFSPAGDLLATGDGGGNVRLWDPVTGECRSELAGHTGRVYAVAFHPDGQSLASGDTDGGIRVWDPKTGRVTHQLSGHSGAVYCVVYSPDGSLLASCDSDGNVRLWDSVTGQVAHVLSGHKASVWPMVFRPDGTQLVTSGNDGTTRLWDPASGQCRHVLRGHGRRITGVRFSPAGDQLATSGNDGIVRLWHPRTGQRLTQLKRSSDRLISVFFSPVGNRLATASNDGAIYLWSASGAYEREMNVETDHLWAEAFSPDGDVIATANDDDSVRLWYSTTGRPMRTFADHHGRVRSIAFSPDGGRMATGCDDRTVRLWDVDTGSCIATLPGHTDRVYSVVFNPAGTVLASASNDGTARLWDATSGAPGYTLTGHRGRLWSAAFSPDGAVLATAGDDLVVRLWDVGTGAHLHTLAGHARRVWSVTFSPDGTLLASAGDDGTVVLWGIGGDGPPSLRLTLLGLPEGWAALAPDGRYKQEGDVAGQFWHAVGMCRFGSGELDPYLTAVRQLPFDAEF